MNLFWIQLALLPFFTNCQEDYDYFIDPSSVEGNAELYSDKEGNEYAFFSNKVTWSEAEVLCSTKKGHLVEIIKEDMGIFIAQALSESALGNDALWVGAEYQDSVWTWMQSKKVISTPGQGVAFPQKEFPYWVEDPSEDKSKNQSCLALSRWDHDSYLIAPLPCSLERPFICSIPPGGNTSAPQFVPPVIEGDRYRYTLYHAEVSWKEAVAFCLDKGTKLASMNFKNTGSDSDFMLLSQRMLRSRPVIENAWLNGKFEKENFKWMWVSLNEEISTLAPKSGRTDDPGLNDPPWFRGGNIFQQGCLLLDRHLCDKPVFVEARCDRKRSFICQEEKNIKKADEFGQLDGGLWMSSVPRTWQSALTRCKECFNEGHLLSLDGKLQDDTALMEITDGMSKWKTEVRHIWLAGHLSSDAQKWNWITDGDADRPGSEINNEAFSVIASQTSNVQVTVDCLTSSVKNLKISAFQCLNMDRENQRHVFFYGLSCNVPQLFYCESKSQEYNCPDDGSRSRNDKDVHGDGGDNGDGDDDENVTTEAAVDYSTEGPVGNTDTEETTTPTPDADVLPDGAAPTDSDEEAPTHAPEEAPTDGEEESATDGATEAPTNDPEEAPTDVSEESATDGTEEAPADSSEASPTNGPEESPTNGPEEAPTESPEESPTNSAEESATDGVEEAPTHAPEEASLDAAAEVSTDGPEEAPTDGAEEATTHAPEESPTNAPEEAPTDGPEEAPTAGDGETTTHAPEEAPTDGPEEAPTDGAEEATTHAPEEAPTDGPEEAPTDGPEEAPTDGAGKPTTHAPEEAPTDGAEEASTDAP